MASIINIFSLIVLISTSQGNCVCLCLCYAVPLTLMDYCFVLAMELLGSPRIHGISKIIYGKSNEKLVLTCEADAPIYWHLPKFFQVTLLSAQ